MWFDGWPTVLRTVVAGLTAYGALIIFLRLSGKRTLAKMNAFDLVVTVALGSTLSTILVSKEVAIVSGLTALGMLIVLQYGVAWLMVRSPHFRRIIRSEPARLFAGGDFDEAAMRRERVTHAELLAAMRDSGYAGPAEVEEIYLENDGSFSVIPRK